MGDNYPRKGPVTMCGSQNERKLKLNFSVEVLPELEPLPNMFKNVLDSVVSAVFQTWKLQEKDIQERQDLLADLQKYIKQLFIDPKLELVGSSCNGFGFKQTDVDICLTFLETKLIKGEDREIIWKLGQKLQKFKDLHSVQALTKAMVPIVKFIHHKSKLEGDINLHTLAPHKTHMLCKYASIDCRVKKLGCTLEYFAKVCNICDSSKGSLSSYAYILMMLYFLQQRSPPVIPVLQELNDATEYEEMVDGWNVWFFKELDKLPEVWPDYGKNKESVGELWLGFLRFYTEEFNYKEYVISVRQRECLTKLDKGWNSNRLSIEDPFDTNDNVATRLSTKMNDYIMKAFIKGRKIFGTPLERPPHPSESFYGYFFNAENLTDGRPPTDRGCWTCGDIDHIKENCPKS